MLRAKNISIFALMAFLLTMTVMYHPLCAYAEEKTATIEGMYVMGGNDSMNVGRDEAVKNAMKKAAEMAGTYVESYSEMHNRVLTKDEVKAVSAAIVYVDSQSPPSYRIEDNGKMVAHITLDVRFKELDEEMLVKILAASAPKVANTEKEIVYVRPPSSVSASPPQSNKAATSAQKYIKNSDNMLIIDARGFKDRIISPSSKRGRTGFPFIGISEVVTESGRVVASWRYGTEAEQRATKQSFACPFQTCEDYGAIQNADSIPMAECVGLVMVTQSPHYNIMISDSEAAQINGCIKPQDVVLLL